MTAAAHKAAWQDLQRELGEGAAGLPALDKLSESDLRKLAEIYRASRLRQRQTLNQAMEDALGHVPLLLRGAVRKIMFG